MLQLFYRAQRQKSLQSVSAAGDGILDHAMVAAGEISGMARTLGPSRIWSGAANIDLIT